MTKILILICLISLVLIVLLYLPAIINKCKLGDLTGKSFYKKSQEGNILYVEYMDKELGYNFRQATIDDINILREYNYIQ